jgi:hypothetical protein
VVTSRSRPAPEAGTRVLLDVERVTRFRGEVVLQGRDEAHDVRRAAGTVEPDSAPAGVVLLDVILAALQRASSSRAVTRVANEQVPLLQARGQAGAGERLVGRGRRGGGGHRPGYPVRTTRGSGRVLGGTPGSARSAGSAWSAGSARSAGSAAGTTAGGGISALFTYAAPWFQGIGFPKFARNRRLEAGQRGVNGAGPNPTQP